MLRFSPRRILALAGGALLFIVVLGLQCRREPKTYEDCILQKVTAGMSNDAVRAVVMACGMKFAPPQTSGVGETTEIETTTTEP